MSIHENITSTSWKKINYGFPIWYGILIPTEKRNHQILILEIPELQEHPVLKKWLFLKQDNE